MSTGRDWRNFNNAWRYDDPTRSFGRQLIRISTRFLWPLWHPHKTVKALEPWGILLAAIGLITAVASFWIDHHDRVQERTVRAWQLVTTPAPGNSGKKAALEYLNQQVWFGCIYGSCWLRLKDSESLNGINLGVDNNGKGKEYQVGTWLYAVNLTFADLNRANLSGAYLRAADFLLANLIEANLSEAILTNASFRGADLRHANFSGAELHGVDLRSANLRNARQLEQSSLDHACGNEHTMLDDGMTIPLCSEVEWFELLHGRRYQDR